MATPVQVPNMNPTGVLGAGFGNTSGGGTGGPGNMNFGNAANPVAPIGSNPTTFNPMSPGSSTPFMGSGPSYGPPGRPQTAVTANPGSPTGTGTVTSEGSTTQTGNPYGQSQSQQNWTEKYLQETFGGGMGSLVYQYLMSNGGYNSAVTQQSIDSQVNAEGKQISLGANDLASRMGASGVSAGSSSYGQALTGYEDQAVQQENAITAQEYYNMWNESQQRESQMMQFAAEGTGKTLANKPNWMDYASMGLGAITDIATLGQSGAFGGAVQDKMGGG